MPRPESRAPTGQRSSGPRTTPSADGSACLIVLSPRPRHRTRGCAPLRNKTETCSSGGPMPCGSSWTRWTRSRSCRWSDRRESGNPRSCRPVCSRAWKRRRPTGAWRPSCPGRTCPWPWPQPWPGCLARRPSCRGASWKPGKTTCRSTASRRPPRRLAMNGGCTPRSSSTSSRRRWSRTAKTTRFCGS
jgi:hypothetical protein